MNGFSKTGPQTAQSWVCRCGTMNVGTVLCQNCNLAISKEGRIMPRDELIPPTKPFPSFLYLLFIIAVAVVVGVVVVLFV